MKSFEERADELLAEEATQPERWMYLSFAGDKFNGAVVIKARGLVSAICQTHRLGINPGGEVAAMDVPDSGLPPEEYRNRCLTREDIQKCWP